MTMVYSVLDEKIAQRLSETVIEKEQTMNYISLVLVRAKNSEGFNDDPILCLAPAWSLHKGETCILENSEIAFVEDVITEAPDADVTKWALTAFNCTKLSELPKISHSASKLKNPLEVANATSE